MNDGRCGDCTGQHHQSVVGRTELDRVTYGRPVYKRPQHFVARCVVRMS